MSPPKIKRMREQYDDEIETDVTDLLWSFLGSALHAVLERGKTENCITEERLFANINDVTISGAIDLQQETSFGIVITDFKMTRAWAVMQQKEEWVQQLNIYKWLVETVKKERVEKIQICAFIRDYNTHESSREGYPPAPIHTFELPMWDSVKTETYIRERLEMHREAKMAQDFGEALQPCSDAERWMSETIFAVKRDGRKTAIRLFKTIEEANELAEKEKGYVETRWGEPRRCVGNFCGVSKWCDQYQGAQNDTN
jgi:hypothetical protein